MYIYKWVNPPINRNPCCQQIVFYPSRVQSGRVEPSRGAALAPRPNGISCWLTRAPRRLFTPKQRLFTPARRLSTPARLLFRHGASSHRHGACSHRHGACSHRRGACSGTAPVHTGAAPVHTGAPPRPSGTGRASVIVTQSEAYLSPTASVSGCPASASGRCSTIETPRRVICEKRTVSLSASGLPYIYIYSHIYIGVCVCVYVCVCVCIYILGEVQHHRDAAQRDVRD